MNKDKGCLSVIFPISELYREGHMAKFYSICYANGTHRFSPNGQTEAIASSPLHFNLIQTTNTKPTKISVSAIDRHSSVQAFNITYSSMKMGWIGESIESVKSIKMRQSLFQIISLGMIVSSALMIWKGLMCITGSESPVVVVLSESMEPGFQRGDILFLHMSKDPIRAGEIVVFNVKGRDIPIVHRVIEVHERQQTGEVDILTKGDNNYVDDRMLYAQGQFWLKRQHIMGKAVGFLPYLGWATIIMTEKPIIKYVLIGVLGLLVITSKD